MKSFGSVSGSGLGKLLIGNLGVSQKVANCCDAFCASVS